MVSIIVAPEQKFLMENDSTYREAAHLAIYMVKVFYPENDVFTLSDSTIGIISQIDNMVTGLKRIK